MHVFDLVKFLLACIDHRNTPEHLARWSKKKDPYAYYLEQRECEYDSKDLVDFYKPALIGVIIFTSTSDKILNKYYIGPTPLEEMASQIATVHGTCGNNRDYHFLLGKAVYDIIFFFFYLVKNLSTHITLLIPTHKQIQMAYKYYSTCQLIIDPHHCHMSTLNVAMSLSHQCPCSPHHLIYPHIK
ncbi:hypothetical protein UlMin_015734 [Ulmus minor]